MPDLVLTLPYQLDGAALCKMAARFTDDCTPAFPDRVHFDFGKLRFVKPSGVTFLSNLTFWLYRRGSKVFFDNYQHNSEAIRFLDDSLFFEQHLGAKLNHASSPRSTTRPLQRVDHDKSHDWLRSNFVPWLSTAINVSPASLYELQVCVSEIFNNIKDHTELDVGSLFIQHFPKLKRVNIAVADFGRGIPAAVRTAAPHLDDDGTAIIQAVQNGFTSQSTLRNSGIGLDYLLRTVVAQNGGTVSIFSLSGYVMFTPGDEVLHRAAYLGAGSAQVQRLTFRSELTRSSVGTMSWRSLSGDPCC